MSQKSNIIQLPYKFEPRDYQARMLRNYWKEGYKHFLYVWHRRAGKTKMCVNHLIAAAVERVGAYYIISPQLNQARRNIWEARGDDGIAFLDHFPKELVHRADNQQMKIYLKNGSIIGLAGSDGQNYNKLRGMNILGYVLDEYATQNPEVREILIPMIAQNGGWEIIISTPEGHNHFYYLYNRLKNSDKFITEILTVDDTKKANGDPVLNQESIKMMIEEGGWSEEKAKQELWCDFSAAVVGAVFGNQMRAVHQDNRLFDFPIMNDTPVHTAWDLGQSDSTAIWFFQVYPDYVHVVSYYENRYQELSHYVNELHKFREKHGIVFGHHWFPHDGNNKSGPRKESWKMRAEQLGLNARILPRDLKKSLMIERARSTFKIFKFHQSNCQRGIDCLLEYKYEFNEAMQLVSNQPLHNWASHGADAFMYMCKVVKEKPANIIGQPLHRRVGM
jgi:phage terminase large subunit